MNTIVKEIGSIFSVQLLRTILQLAIIPILSRALSPELFGEFALVFSLYAVAIKFRDFGIHHFVLANRIDNLTKLKNLSVATFYHSLAISVLFFCVSVFVIKSQLNIIWISILSVNLILSYHLNLLDSYYRGKGDLRKIFLVDRLHLILFFLVNSLFIMFKLNLEYLLIVNPLLIYLSQFTHFRKKIYRIFTTKSRPKRVYNKEIIRFFIRDLITPVELFGLNVVVGHFGAATLGNFNRASVLASAPTTLIGQNLYNGMLSKNVLIHRNYINLLLLITPAVFLIIKCMAAFLVQLILGSGWDVAAILLPYVLSFYYVHWVSEIGSLRFWRDEHKRLLHFKVWDGVIVLVLIIVNQIRYFDVEAILALLLVGKWLKGMFFVAKS